MKRKRPSSWQDHSISRTDASPNRSSGTCQWKIAPACVTTCIILGTVLRPLEPIHGFPASRAPSYRFSHRWRQERQHFESTEDLAFCRLHAETSTLGDVRSVERSLEQLGPSGAIEVDNCDDESIADNEFPPWLQVPSTKDRMDDIDYDVQRLEYKMLEHGFSVSDVREIVAALYCVMAADDSSGGWSTRGVIDFIRLLLETEAEQLLTKQVILASILHYAECIEARRNRLQDKISGILRPLSLSAESEHSTRLMTGGDFLSLQGTVAPSANAYPPSGGESCRALVPVGSVKREYINDSSARLIAEGAAQIKRAEVLAHVVLHANVETNNSGACTRRHASQMRSLMLTVMDDWRALAIRCVASLYRLEGILKVLNDEDRPEPRTLLMLRTAREGMLIYASLAQRLGMHRLKARIEERAFQILYRRQYQAVTSIYLENGAAMQMLSSYLLHSISQLLQHDDALMSNIEGIHVTARVKEPYSFWRKLLKTRLRSKPAILRSSRDVPSRDAVSSLFNSEGVVVSSSRSTSLSVADVQDGIALRVVLKARKWSDDELDRDTRSREQLLCYYVQHIIRTKWPELDSDRVKDYIQNPKPNGYQSLHHTSAVSANGIDYFPFEVQIRSEDMHRIAEYGVAAHWDYKLGSTMANSSSSIVPVKWASDDWNATSVSPVSQQGDGSGVTENVSHAQDSPKQSHVSASESYLDALITAKEGLLKETIYVFMTVQSNASSSEQGRIVSMPPRSTVGDALIALNVTSLHGSSSSAHYTIRKNGLLAGLNDMIDNGDVIVVGEPLPVSLTGRLTSHK